MERISARLSDANMEWRPAPGKWNAREILCHLADCEIVFGFRLRQTLAAPNHVIQTFDQDNWAKVYDGMGARAAIATFASLRAWNLQLIGSTSETGMATKVNHPERGDMTFRTIIETMAGHDINHLEQLARLSE